MIKARRIGKFTVSEKLLHDAVDTGHGANLFVGMVPLDVQRDWLTGRTTFTAWHPDFQAVEENRTVPEYVPRFDNGTTAPTWVHVEGT